MRMLVTGASGFVAAALCKHLIASGHSLIRSGRGVGPASDLDVGDIGPTTDWTLALAGGADVVIHLAARVHQMRDCARDPLQEFRSVNVEGTTGLARKAAEAGVKRFIFLSSIKVCGETTRPGCAFAPDDRPHPQDSYALSKFEAEGALWALGRETGMEIVVIRPPLVYGPGVRGNFPSLVKLAQSGVPLPLGGVRNLRSLLALDNLIDFVALCADRDRSPGASNQVFHVADCHAVSTPELLCRIAAAAGGRACLISIPETWLNLGARVLGKASVADRLLGSLVVDGSKAERLLGWCPPTTLDEQLKKMMSRDADS